MIQKMCLVKLVIYGHNAIFIYVEMLVYSCNRCPYSHAAWMENNQYINSISFLIHLSVYGRRVSTFMIEGGSRGTKCVC